MFRISRGSIDPPLTINMKANGSALDLTGYSTLKLKVAATTEAAAALIDKTLTLVGAATAGVVRADWSGSDTNLAEGDYEAQVYIDWGAGSVTKYPPEGFIFRVEPALLVG
jgi:hypothetical protein